MSRLALRLPRQLLGSARRQRRRRHLDHASSPTAPSATWRRRRATSRRRGTRASSSSTATSSTARPTASATCAGRSTTTGLRLVAVYSGGELHLRRHPRRGAGAHRARRRTPPRRSAPSTSSSAAAPSAPTALADGDYDALARGLDRVVAIARERGLAAHYHPHLSTIVEGPDEVRRDLRQDVDRLLSRHRPSGGGRRRAGRHGARAQGPHLLCPPQGLAARAVRLHAGRRGRLRQRRRDSSALAEIGYRGWITNELDSLAGPGRRRAAQPRISSRRRTARMNAPETEAPTRTKPRRGNR